jgi:membrane-bound inhibitor of C-type lysozyme
MIQATVPVRVAAAVVSSTLLLFGCAEISEFDRSATSGGMATLICDNGKTFTVTYQDDFENAIVETDGRRVELARVHTTLGLSPTPAGRSPLGDRDDAGFDTFGQRQERIQAATGTTGVRYSDGDNLLLSRGRQATLELDGETYSNCETPR